MEDKGLCDLEGFKSCYFYEVKYMLLCFLEDELGKVLGENCRMWLKDLRFEVDSYGLLLVFSKFGFIIKYSLVYINVD